MTLGNTLAITFLVVHRANPLKIVHRLSSLLGAIVALYRHKMILLLIDLLLASTCTSRHGVNMYLSLGPSLKFIIKRIRIYGTSLKVAIE